ncbi:MAG: beta-lactamase family protein [Actinobacteria bacterium]|nr:beta-lactamase family protein [Actinomycetota bacterium]
MRRIAVAVVGGALLASACSTGSQQTGATGTSGTSRTSPTSVSSNITFDRAKLQATVETTAKELLSPAAVAIVKTPQGELRMAYGNTTYGGSTPVTIDDRYRIGSVTKTFTGTVILQLVQEGKLKLDDPVSKYRADVPNGQKITITQLLNMRSGLYNYSESLELNESIDKDPQAVWTTDRMLRIAFAREPYFPPDEGFHYSNTNTVLLGLIAEQLDGKPLATIFQDRLFTPLKMTRTTFPLADNTVMERPYPNSYQFGTNVETMESLALPEDQQAAAYAGTLKPYDVTDNNTSWTWAAGQAISTADDMAIWAQAQGNGTLLNPELQKLRLDSPQPTAPNAPPTAPKYGLGIAKFATMFGHTGELPGFNNIVIYDPVEQVTIVVWTNLGSAPNGQAVATTIGRKLMADLYGPPTTSGSQPAGTAPSGTGTTMGDDLDNQ